MSAPPAGILSLPPEITQRIFKECLPTRSNAPGPSLPSTEPSQLSQQAPLLLTQICRGWRGISLDTPQLWQSIVVNAPVSPLMVGLWMSRGGNLPRDISFTAYDEKEGTYFLEESMDYCLQWRDVELSLPMESFSAVTHHGPFPLLSSLSLSTTSGVFDGDQTIAFQGAPLLLQATLREFPFLAPDIAWGQLTTLDMTAHQADEGIATLQNCTGLVDLQFLLLDHAQNGIPPLTLLSLRSLKTAGHSILPLLITPNLERLAIWGPGFSNDMDLLTTSLHDLLERSACPLGYLSFRTPPDIPAAAFKAFLEAAPSVTELALTFQFSNGLEKLVTVLQSADVLPKLTTLRIMDMSRAAEATMPFDPLLDTLRVRRDAVDGRTTLEMLSLSIRSRSQGPGRVCPNAALSKFAGLAEEGLRIRIVCDGIVLMGE
ncbi:hypothetical protein B0H17DRAFT_378370 [Mycena rosella]|uniref:F-box domain-containing protein n=1 Tax=Mycena rosella TaxID=1033263 RepID=A0AAD7CNT9_MYCRO|nr:hypothetical protein B0H17DRAFT_378370 [Mycena rosella]